MKIKNFILPLSLASFVALFMASCNSEPSSPDECVSFLHDKRFAVFKFDYEKHEYLAVYVPCRNCANLSRCARWEMSNFVHSPNCGCHKADGHPYAHEESDEESKDPFDW